MSSLLIRDESLPIDTSLSVTSLQSESHSVFRLQQQTWSMHTTLPRAISLSLSLSLSHHRRHHHCVDTHILTRARTHTHAATTHATPGTSTTPTGRRTVRTSSTCATCLSSARIFLGPGTRSRTGSSCGTGLDSRTGQESSSTASRSPRPRHPSRGM